MDFYHNTGDQYVVTGVLATGRRFKAITTDNPHHALGINLFRGSVWQVPAGKTVRKLVKRVWN